MLKDTQTAGNGALSILISHPCAFGSDGLKSLESHLSALPNNTSVYSRAFTVKIFIHLFLYRRSCTEIV